MRSTLRAQIEIDGKRYGHVKRYSNRVMVAMSLRREGFDAKAVVL